MAEPLIPISPNTVHQQSPHRQSSGDPFKGDSPNMSSEGSDYSIIDYNVPTVHSSTTVTKTFTSNVEKHSRSTTNSPQKVLKKPKYEVDVEVEDSLMDHDDVFNSGNDKDDSMAFDADMTGFSQAAFTRTPMGAGIRRESEEEVGETTVGKQLLRESFRKDQPSSPTKQTPGRAQFTSPPHTPETVTPRNNPSRLATLSQYSKSPESTPNRTPNERTTNLLLDFTQQFNNVRAFPLNPTTPNRTRRSQSVSPTKGFRSRADENGSPTKNPLPTATPNERKFLLDFDIPPPPTPRSIPSITPKELESLKSTYLAQIASLKAEVSGKDAEIGGLKGAITDAERRCANSKVELREVREEAEDLASRSGVLESKLQEASKMISEARQQIEGHSREMELVRNEYEGVQRDHKQSKDQLSNVQQELADVKRNLAAVKQDLIVEQQKKSSFSSSRPSTGVDVEAAVAKAVAATNATKEADINASVEKVAKELHSLYKSKHEQKVTALKTSYAARWEKRVKELETRNAELAGSNNNLSSQLRRAEEEKEEHLTGPMLSPHPDHGSASAELQKLEAALKLAQEQIGSLQREVDAERTEKGDLVLAVDELLAMGGAPALAETGGIENLRGSVNRASGIGIARALGSPMKMDRDSEWKTSSLRGGIERMGSGNTSSAANSRFGLGSR